MSTFTWLAEYGASQDITPKVNTAKFGDGYEQRTRNGINTKPREWSLTFNKVSSEIDKIETFLSNRGGVESFDWTPPRGSSGKWLCSSWQRSIPSPAYDSLTCKFSEVFGE